MKKKELIQISKNYIIIDLICEFCKTTERKQISFDTILENITCKNCNKKTAK